MRTATPIRNRCRERGYVLLILLLAIALLSVGFLAVVERLDFQIRRDREEEMIHRGVEYSRAVRKYVRKFGRYPTSIEALESTNNVRFLRKRYKDPVTGKEFKILHYGDLQGISAGPVRTPNAPNPAVISPMQTVAAVTQTGSQQLALDPKDIVNPEGAISSDPDNPTVAEPTVDATAPGLQQANDGQANTPEANGVAVIGVASFSKRKSIRVFNNKDHYNQWQFVYDPSSDRQGLIIAPHQPLLKVATPAPADEQAHGQEGSSVANTGLSTPSPGAAQ